MARRPELDFIERIESKPLTEDEVGQIQLLIQTYEADCAATNRQRLEAEILQLPLSERAYLLHRLVDSLTPPASVEPTLKVAHKTRATSHDEPKRKRPAKARVSS